MKFTNEFIGEYLQMLDATPKEVAINALIEVRKLIKENEELKEKNEKLGNIIHTMYNGRQNYIVYCNDGVLFQKVEKQMREEGLLEDEKET